MDNTPAVKTHSLAHQIFYGEHLRYFCQEGRIMLGKNWPYPKLLFFFSIFKSNSDQNASLICVFVRIWQNLRYISSYLHSPTISLGEIILDQRGSYTHERHSFMRRYV